MWRIVLPVLLLATAVFGTTPASAKILAHNDISQQQLHLYVNGAKRATWPVPTARRGYANTRSRITR